MICRNLLAAKSFVEAQRIMPSPQAFFAQNLASSHAFEFRSSGLSNAERPITTKKDKIVAISSIFNFIINPRVSAPFGEQAEPTGDAHVRSWHLTGRESRVHLRGLYHMKSFPGSRPRYRSFLKVDAKSHNAPWPSTKPIVPTIFSG